MANETSGKGPEQGKPERYTVGPWEMQDALTGEMLRGFAVYWRGEARFTSPRRDACVRRAAFWNGRLPRPK